MPIMVAKLVICEEDILWNFYPYIILHLSSENPNGAPMIFTILFSIQKDKKVTTIYIYNKLPQKKKVNMRRLLWTIFPLGNCFIQV